MRSLRGTLLAIIAAAWGHAALSAVTFTADNTEVVIERKALPVVKFAASISSSFSQLFLAFILCCASDDVFRFACLTFAGSRAFALV